jgi:hypothetical protein
MAHKFEIPQTVYMVLALLRISHCKDSSVRVLLAIEYREQSDLKPGMGYTIV